MFGLKSTLFSSRSHIFGKGLVYINVVSILLSEGKSFLLRKTGIQER